MKGSVEMKSRAAVLFEAPGEWNIVEVEVDDPKEFEVLVRFKHAGLCPRDNSSGTYQGRTGISGRGRPELRLAAWRAVFGALHHNPVLAARHAHLVGRAENPLTDTQARVAVAASYPDDVAAIIGRYDASPPVSSGSTSMDQSMSVVAFHCDRLALA